MNDEREPLQRNVAGKVLVDERLERAPSPFILMRVACARRVEADGIIALLYSGHFVRFNKQDLGARIEKSPDQPRRSRPIDVNPLARHPFHVHVNGALTLGENTADSVGLRIALRTPARHVESGWSRARGHRRNHPRPALLPRVRTSVVRGALSPQPLRLMAQTNPHSPPTFRINGVVSKMPEFRDTFGCKAGDPMVRDPACRVR